MHKKIALIFLVCLLLSVVNSFGRMSLSFELQPLLITAEGPGQLILDEIMVNAKGKEINLQYTTTTNKVYINPTFNLSTLINLGLNLASHNQLLELQASSWFYSYQKEKSHHLEAEASTDTELNKNMVHLWGGNFRLPEQRNFWVTNREHPSGFSPIKWESSLKFNATANKVFLSVNMIQVEDAELDFLIGLQMSSLYHSLYRKINMNALSFTEEKINDYHVDFRNHITLQTGGSSKYNLAVGPSIGVGGFIKVENIIFLGSADHAWALAKNIQGNHFTDIDDYQFEIRETGEIVQTGKATGKIPFSKTTQSTIPITTLTGGVKASFGRFQMGISSFYSHWQNVHLTPTLNYRNLTWNTHKRDLYIFGLGITIGIQF